MKTNGIRFPLLFILVCLGWFLSLFPAVYGHSQEQKPRNPSPAQGASPAAAIGQDSNVMTLERCIEIALEKNPEIAAARSDISAAESRFDVARAAYWPQLSAEGGYLRLRDVAQVVQATGPVEILREDQVKEVIIRGDAADVSVGQALDELKKAMATFELPGGYEIFYGGQAQMMRDMTRAVVMILGFALFFAFAVLAVQFNSLMLPVLVLSVIPFCLGGTLLALFLTGIPLGATLIIGILVIIALTINQGVLLVTFAESLRADEALPAGDAMVNAAKIRLRPVLMLSLCFIAGLIPLALNIEEGGDMLQPMAVGAIGGLAVGVSVTLPLLPVIYTAVAGHSRGRSITESLKGLWSRVAALKRAR